jgi:hypothetical protein
MKTNIYHNMTRKILLFSFITLFFVSQNAFSSDNFKIKTKSDMAVFVIEYANEIVSDNVSLSLEDWMLNSYHWEIPSEMNSEIEIKNEIELWMASSDHFNSMNYSNAESLEPWMSNPCHWKIVSNDICETNYNEKYSEENYHIHDWMKNPYFFQI